MSPSDISKQLSRFQFRYCAEEDLQRGIAQALAGEPSLKREVRLTPLDRVDFFLADHGLVIEVKIKGSASSVLRQLDRYAALEMVKGIILVTTRSVQALQMPATLHGKPLSVLCLRQL